MGPRHAAGLPDTSNTTNIFPQKEILAIGKLSWIWKFSTDVDHHHQVLALLDMQNLMPDTVTCEMNNETFLIFGRWSMRQL